MKKEKATFGKRLYFTLLEKYLKGSRTFPDITADDKVFAPNTLGLNKSGLTNSNDNRMGNTQAENELARLKKKGDYKGKQN